MSRPQHLPTTPLVCCIVYSDELADGGSHLGNSTSSGGISLYDQCVGLLFVGGPRASGDSAPRRASTDLLGCQSFCFNVWAAVQEKQSLALAQGPAFDSYPLFESGASSSDQSIVAVDAAHQGELLDVSGSILALTALQRKVASAGGAPVPFISSQIHRGALDVAESRGVLAVEFCAQGLPNVLIRPGATDWTPILMIAGSEPLSRTVSGVALLKRSKVEVVLDLLRVGWVDGGSELATWLPGEVRSYVHDFRKPQSYFACLLSSDSIIAFGGKEHRASSA